MASDTDAYNRKEFEACVTGSILTAELLRSEANGEKNFKPPTLTVKEDAWLSKNVLQIDIDRDGDGKPDGTAKVNRSAGGGITSIDLDFNNDGKIDGKIATDRSTFGYINFMKIDLKNNGTTDAKLTPTKSFLGYVTSMDIDRKNDGKVDGKLTYQFNYSLSNYYSHIAVDGKNSGRTDFTMAADRATLSMRLNFLKPKQ